MQQRIPTHDGSPEQRISSERPATLAVLSQSANPLIVVQGRQGGAY